VEFSTVDDLFVIISGCKFVIFTHFLCEGIVFTNSVLVVLAYSRDCMLVLIPIKR